MTTFSIVLALLLFLLCSYGINTWDVCTALPSVA